MSKLKSVLFLCLLLFPFISYAGTVQLPQTGQTKCYDEAGTEIDCSGTGQDGDIRAGVSWPSPRFTDNGDGTVTDNLTGLMWVKSPDSNGRAWNDAVDYCNNLDFAGYTDWRLPNVNELESLVNADKSNTATWLNSQGFSNVQQSRPYWSSSTRASSKGVALNVNMNYGYVDYSNKLLNEYVWPVRSGQ